MVHLFMKEKKIQNSSQQQLGITVLLRDPHFPLNYVLKYVQGFHLFSSLLRGHVHGAWGEVRPLGVTMIGMFALPVRHERGACSL